jgi:flagellar protein FliO/FliZ
MRLVVRPFLVVPTMLIASDVVAVTGTRGDGVTPGLLAPGDAVEYLLGVVTVMCALGVFAYVLRRLQQRQAFGTSSPMRVRGSLPLGGKERLLLVEAEGERLLLGVSPGGVQLVHRLSPLEVVAPTGEAAEGTWLNRVLNGEGIR